MNQSKPVLQVVSLLESVGYRQLPTPIRIASVPFEFTALLVGSVRSHDLIAIFDTVVDPEDRIRQKVEGLGRALDLVGSRRPFTVVIVGPPPGRSTLEALARVSRVLTVEAPSLDVEDISLDDTLAVLLPLTLPSASEVGRDPLEEVREILGANRDFDSLSKVYAAAQLGSDSVTNTFFTVFNGHLNLDSENSLS